MVDFRITHLLVPHPKHIEAGGVIGMPPSPTICICLVSVPSPRLDPLVPNRLEEIQPGGSPGRVKENSILLMLDYISTAAASDP